jgi:hypothetical protein
VLGVVAAFLAGCGGSPAPSQPSTSVTTTPPLSSAVTSIAATPPAPRTGPLTTGPNVRPGEKPPVLPPLTQQHKPDGALAFARYYYQILDWSIATNDGYLLSSVSAPGCKSCARYLSGFSVQEQGKAVQHGGRIHIIAAEIAHGSFHFHSDVVTQVRIRQDAYSVSHPPLSAMIRHAAADYTSFVFVSWIGSGWKIIEEAAP